MEGEDKFGFFVCELPIHRSKRFQLLFDVLLFLILRVQQNFQNLRSIGANAKTLSNDFNGTDDILQNRVMNRSQSAGTRPNFETSSFEVLSDDRSLSDDDDVSFCLLFQFHHQPSMDISNMSLENAIRHENDNALLPALLDLHFSGRRKDDVRQIGAEFRLT